MISEGPCDTEDWSNGCWKFSYANKRIKYIVKLRHYCNTVLWFSLYFYQINVALSIRDFFSNINILRHIFLLYCNVA